MKSRTFRMLFGIVLAIVFSVVVWKLISELRTIHERSAVKAIAAALAGDLRTEANLSAIFPQSQSPYRMKGDSYMKWMEKKFRNGALDPANNDFTVDMWGNQYEIRAESSRDGLVKLSVSSSGRDGQFGTDDDIVVKGALRFEKVSGIESE